MTYLPLLLVDQLSVAARDLLVGCSQMNVIGSRQWVRKSFFDFF